MKVQKPKAEKIMIYVFGNNDSKLDNKPFKFIDTLKENNLELYNNFAFIPIDPNNDLPLGNTTTILILDTIYGISEPSLITETNISKIKNNKTSSVHDYDLGFQLKYLLKLGKIKNFTIIGIPGDKRLNYFLIQSIFKKLVAHDIQGS